jgi:simple sugar transport system ATP-binding protein
MDRPDLKSAPLISIRNVTKVFPGGHEANSHIDLDIYAGEIHALLGENGAGKTTLMNILSGIYRADIGDFWVRGSQVHIKTPKDAIGHGIAMVHQHFRLIPCHTVAENIVLGLSTSFFSPLKEVLKSIRDFSTKYNLVINPSARLCDLSSGEQQRVEIVKALIRGAGILILDEPTSVLTPQEAGELFTILNKMKAEGKAVIFITHKLEEVLGVADHITVLRQGKIVDSFRAEKIKSKGDEEAKKDLACMMVGKEVILKVKKETLDKGEPVLKVEGLHVYNERGIEAVRGVTFSVRKGEIFGVLGVAGNGQRELVEAIVGLRGHLGKISKEGGNMGYVPENRLHMGTVPGLNLADNIILTCYKDFSGMLFLKLPLIRKHAEKLLYEFRVSARDLKVPAGQLSGGNIQRVILARELSQNPALLIAEQPTHGLDVGSTEDVWKALLEQRRTAGVLLVSGDLEEILSLSDRVGVIFQGRIVDILDSTSAKDRIDEIGLMIYTGLLKRKGKTI